MLIYTYFLFQNSIAPILALGAVPSAPVDFGQLKVGGFSWGGFFKDDRSF